MSMLTYEADNLISLKGKENENYSRNLKKIYLFGLYSSLLQFGLGIVKLCDDCDDNEKLESNITEALRHFILCATIAADGSHDASTTTDKIYLIRKFISDRDKEKIPKEYQKDFQIGGLYPNRLTHFSVFGKIFAATCQLILYLHNPQEEKQKNIEFLIQDLYDRDTLKANPKYVLGQERYNGHLSHQIDRIEEYIKQEMKTAKQHSNLKDLRDTIVTDIFKCLRGDKL
jgi:hypothetical protein